MLSVEDLELVKDQHSGTIVRFRPDTTDMVEKEVLQKYPFDDGWAWKGQMLEKRFSFKQKIDEIGAAFQLAEQLLQEIGMAVKILKVVKS